jgi:hypothetical protein
MMNDRKLSRHRSEKSRGKLDTRYTGKLKGTFNRAIRRYWKLFIHKA